MLLAALGVAQVQVRPAPRVALLTTGRELVDDPTQALASGEIRNSNGPYPVSYTHLDVYKRQAKKCRSVLPVCRQFSQCTAACSNLSLIHI